MNKVARTNLVIPPSTFRNPGHEEAREGIGDEMKGTGKFKFHQAYREVPGVVQRAIK